VSPKRFLAELLYLPFRALSALEIRLAQFRFAQHAQLDKGVRFVPGGVIRNFRGIQQAIRVHSNTVIAGELLTFGHGGDIEVGQWCFIGQGSRVWSADKVIIGNRVLISHDVNVHDTNSHPVDPIQRHAHFREILLHGHPRQIETFPSAPVVIEDDVWIGFNAIILKGVRIGARSIVAAGSIVTSDIPPDSLFIRDRVARKLI